MKTIVMILLFALLSVNAFASEESILPGETIEVTAQPIDKIELTVGTTTFHLDFFTSKQGLMMTIEVTDTNGKMVVLTVCQVSDVQTYEDLVQLEVNPALESVKKTK